MADVAKRKPPPLPGDPGYAFGAWKKSVSDRRSGPKPGGDKPPEPAEEPAVQEAAVDEAESMMEDLGLGHETAEAGMEGISPEAKVIATVTGISPASAEKVWKAAQARDDLSDMDAESLAERLTTDFALLTSLLGTSGSKEPPKTEKPKEERSEAGGPEIEPEAEKE